MINIAFNIRNPFSSRYSNIKCWNGTTLFKHKFWELQLSKTADLIDFFLRYTIKQSHAGLHVGFGLFGYSIEFNFYDCRHWNHILKRWQT